MNSSAPDSDSDLSSSPVAAVDDPGDQSVQSQKKRRKLLFSSSLNNFDSGPLNFDCNENSILQQDHQSAVGPTWNSAAADGKPQNTVITASAKAAAAVENLSLTSSIASGKLHIPLYEDLMASDLSGSCSPAGTCFIRDGPVRQRGLGISTDAGAAGASNEESANKTLCIRGLPSWFNEGELKSLLIRVGDSLSANDFSNLLLQQLNPSFNNNQFKSSTASSNLVRVEVVRDPETRECVGYGFAEFTNHKMAKRILESNSPHLRIHDSNK